MIFRTLRADEIECRIGSVTANGFTLLLYKDARTDRRILDETVPDRWCNTYRRDEEGRLICNVRIRFTDDFGAFWIEREDTGTESYSEKEKGEFSDAFKRSCFKWGIGDALYTAPLIFIRAKTEPQGNGYRLANKSDGYGYKVAQIEYKGGRISKLIITKDGEQKFYFEADKFMEQSQNTIDEKMAQMVLVMAEDEKNKSVLNSMGIHTPAEVKRMTIAQYGDFARRCNQ